MSDFREISKLSVGSKCVIKNCLTKLKTQPSNGVTHYRFPTCLITKNRSERRSEWIKAVIRHNEWNPNWQPRKYTVICNRHFVGGKKSEHPLHPAYNPTIFPSKRKLFHTECSLEKELAQLKAKRLKQSQNPTPILIEDNSTEENSHQIKTEPPDQADEYIIPEPANEYIIPEQADECKISEPAFVKVEDCHWEQEVKKKKRKVVTKDFGCQVNRFTHDIVTTDIMIYNSEKLQGKCHTEVQTTLKPLEYHQPESTKKEIDNWLQKSEFNGIGSINSNKHLMEMCGITFEVFNSILAVLPNMQSNANISKANKLLICLMKLKQGLSYTALAIMFCLPQKDIFRIFMDMLDTLSSIAPEYLYWPKRDTIKNSLPVSIRKEYPNCRAIIDCIEIQIETPVSVEERRSYLEKYRNCTNFKVFFALAPNGCITHKSPSYGGHKSDCTVANDCGFLDLVQEGDVILADRLYPSLKKELEKRKVSLKIPNFTNVPDSPVYVHIKERLDKIKQFKILSFMPLDLLAEMDEVILVCCYLINKQVYAGRVD